MQLQNFYAQDVNGNIVPGAVCTLFVGDSTTLATGLQDVNGAPLSNPFNANAIGLAQVAAPNGLYSLKIESGLIVSTLKVTFADNLQALDQLAGFLGPRAAPPTTRDDGNPLRIGDRYVNTVNNLEYLYKSTGWQPNNLDGQIISNSVNPAYGAALVGGIIANNLTINVPFDKPSIASAMDYIRGFTIARGAIVTIKVADGTYELAPINGNHPQGDLIWMIGNETNPALCTLKVTAAPSSDGLVVSNGHQIGYLNGFKFDLGAKATSANNATAILAVSGASIICGPKIIVNNWYYGIAARGGYISCDYAQVSNAGDVGIWAFNGGGIKCQFAQVSGVSDVANGLGFGIQGEYGSSVDCYGATATTCQVAGIASLSGSSVRAYNTSSTGNIGSGLYARDNASIVAHNAITTGNGAYGIARIGSGSVSGNAITNNTNTLGNNSPAAILDSDFSAGARIVSLAGTLRLDVQEAASIFFNGPGGPQFEIGHAATAVNRMRMLAAATGVAPSMSAVGTDLNIPARISSKGTSDVEIGVGSARIVTVGKGIKIAEGTNAKQGVATLIAGSVVVANTSVTATSRILVSIQQDGGTPGSVRSSARTPGTSFTITSTSALDTSIVAYVIFEQG